MHYRALSKIVPFPREFATSPPTRPEVWSMPAEPLTALLGLDDFDRMLQDGVPAGVLRVVRAGEEVPPAEYTWGERPIERPFAEVVRPGAVTRLLDGGATVVLDAIHRFWRPIGDLGRRLAYEVGLPASATGFLTPAGHPGFPFHHDEGGNLLIQTVGSKTWEVREPLIRDPLPHETLRRSVPTERQLEPELRRPPALRTTLHPGDVLWIPRGWLHSGTATDEPSVHVSLGFVPMLTRYWLAGKLVERLDAQRPEFAGLRRELPWGVMRRPGELAEIVSEVVKELAEALPLLDTPAVSADLSTQLRRSFLEPPRTPAATAAGARIDADTRVVTVTESLFATHRLPDGRLRLLLADSSLTLSGAAADFLEAQCERDSEEPWCARDLTPDVAEAAAVSVVTTLLRAGVVRRQR
ncbi:JmjC domain-containing protein [Streptomyces palmae]|uniref:JmjC domain-containing protein n=1 Tax=Streptomyces palmae TaxID=1701085 RepID=A0A4Z0H7F1_9ACTN|nr:cupin domain-containing protein [Streptomyces palmae]TGB10117.1 hypothetical protein E4099_13070 [Streptomyces palmae]